MGIGKNNFTNRQILTDPMLFLAFGFGSGLAKKAPGTMGTLAAIPIYIVLVQSGQTVYSAVTVMIILSGIWICDAASGKLGMQDYSGIVWDEIAGYLVTMWMLPWSWEGIVMGFVLFRAFDIFKPWPIKWIDRKIHGGFGIMLDDIIAGLFAGLVLKFVM